MVLYLIYPEQRYDGCRDSAGDMFFDAQAQSGL